MSFKTLFVLSVALFFVAIFQESNGLNLTNPCGANEKLMLCGPACPLTCANLANPPACTNNKCVTGCFCRAGFYRKDKACVALASC